MRSQRIAVVKIINIMKGIKPWVRSGGTEAGELLERFFNMFFHSGQLAIFRCKNCQAVSPHRLHMSRKFGGRVATLAPHIYIFLILSKNTGQTACEHGTRKSY